jgi:DNA-binding NarL/FixJ family response regulator
MTVRIALIDDHPMVVDGLTAAFATIADLAVVGRAGSADAARTILARDDIDVALLDVRLEGGNGLQLLAERGDRPGPAVVVMSSFSAAQYATAAARYGAAGFVLKTVPLPTLIEAIRAVAAGASWFNAADTERRLVKLTDRERDVLGLVVTGLSNKEIGARLGMSAKAVEGHLTALYGRYDIRGGRVELAVRAADEGWLDVQPPARRGAAGSARRQAPSRGRGRGT